MLVVTCGYASSKASLSRHSSIGTMIHLIIGLWLGPVALPPCLSIPGGAQGCMLYMSSALPRLKLFPSSL